MKNIYLSAFFVLIYSFCNSQTKDEIVYILPDSVEIIINNYVKACKEKNIDNFYLILEKKEMNYEITIASYNESEKNNISKYVLKSKRKAIICNELIPIVFDYDFKFGTTTPFKELGAIGSREGYYKRQALIRHSPSILFDEYGKILNCEFSIK
jgi:hypothetical protein